MGAREYARRIRELIVSDPLPPKSVAAGWALGMFIGCFIPFGMQLIVSIPLAIRLKVSKIGATVGTLITNPVTIFIIYPMQCWVGSRMIGMPLTWEFLSVDVFPKLKVISLFAPSSWKVLVDLGAPVLGGFFVGGLVLALIMTPLTYFLVKEIVVRRRGRA